MRPPLFAGEDGVQRQRVRDVRDASMRPPLFAGEDIAETRELIEELHASMRPPLFAGEDRPARATGSAAPPRFNEAPAVRGGRLPDEIRFAAGGGVASMRPPLFAGEDAGRPTAALPRLRLQ